MATSSSATFLGVAPGVFINISQVVWMRHEKDESITLYLSAPGPTGNNAINLKDKRVLDGLASVLAVARRGGTSATAGKK
ncbi:MAG TPA: hypothetical protein VFE47_25575 [Tepidisphaeraceae bacterium]|jgi:hypothetical protein|nr:hypothetical protein [Tepidisphaeraceae bacterium]